MRVANATSFLLEVAFVCSVILWAVDVPGLSPLAATFAAGLPALLLTAPFLSAQSSWRLLWRARPVVAHLLYLAAAVTMIALGHLTLGWFVVALTLFSFALSWRLRKQFASLDRPLREQRAQAKQRRLARKSGASGRRAARP